MDIVNFFTNQGEAQKQAAAVEAPAFSLTKVLAAAAAIVGPLATVVVNKATDLNLTEWNWVVLGVGVLGFLAVTASADVLARSVAERAKVAEAALAQLMRFETPLSGRHKQPGTDTDIKVLAVTQGPAPFFLVKEGEAITWLPASEVTIP